MPKVVEYGQPTNLPLIHVISDSIGLTALQLVRATTSQFGQNNTLIEVCSQVESFDQIQDYISHCVERYSYSLPARRMLIFYTLVNHKLALQLLEYAYGHNEIYAIDLISRPIEVIGELTGLKPLEEASALRETDNSYFKRIEALEFTIAHDDGRNPADLTKADIVLIGVSRSSKTPLSIYLAQEGYRVANVPLDPDTLPPKELLSVEKGRLYGLMTSPEILCDIRKKRLGKQSAFVTNYANYEYVVSDLESAHALMRKLGCKIIHTENRAVEETAQEILRYYERAFNLTS